MVANSDSSGKVIDATLNDILGTFQSISNLTNGNLQSAVTSLETNIKIFEEVLYKQQLVIINLASIIQDQVSNLESYDFYGTFKDLCDKALDFLTKVSTLADFEKIGRNSSTETNMTSRILKIKNKYSMYMKIQKAAALNSSILGTIIVNMNDIYEYIAKVDYEDVTIEYLSLNSSIYSLGNEMIEYATVVGTAIMKLITLQTDSDLLKEGCAFELPCGTFLPYDPTKDIDAPKRNGFRAGKYWNGMQTFVGAGWTKNAYYTPGRLMVDPPFAGVWMETGTEEVDSTTADYLLDHKDLTWVNFTWRSGVKFPDNTVYVNNPFYSYGIGRFVSASGFSFVGKIMSFYGFYFSVNGTSASVKNLQILTCKVN
ncbi:hypothetical protein PVAND_016885 [Polypedilum vanderplanki]|uniref:Uncharacterized protein n=1 Tax=Polypedilum vanderplanki TaxID=319348 RepID=A0A9J6BHQ1_POLVA|nr:hypothetical protein PVAND_016885 [Polypedilum vanderplanki]